MALATILPQHLVRHINKFMYYTEEQRLLNFKGFYCNNRYVLKHIRYMYNIYSECFVVNVRHHTLKRLSDEINFYEYLLSNQSLIDIRVP